MPLVLPILGSPGNNHSTNHAGPVRRPGLSRCSSLQYPDDRCRRCRRTGRTVDSIAPSTESTLTSAATGRHLHPQRRPSGHGQKSSSRVTSTFLSEHTASEPENTASSTEEQGKNRQYFHFDLLLWTRRGSFLKDRAVRRRILGPPCIRCGNRGRRPTAPATITNTPGSRSRQASQYRP